MANTTEIVRRVWDDEGCSAVTFGPPLIVRRVCDDEEGVCFEVRPDQDGLGAIEVHTPDDKSKEYFGVVRFTMDKDMARQIGAALIAPADDV